MIWPRYQHDTTDPKDLINITDKNASATRDVKNLFQNLVGKTSSRN